MIFKRLFSYFKPYKVKLILIISITLISAIISIITPKLLGDFITSIYESIKDSSSVQTKYFCNENEMENGKYNGSATYQSGTIQVDDATIKDFNTKGWGTITYDEGFAYSSNTAATTGGAVEIRTGSSAKFDGVEATGNVAGTAF